MNAHRLSGVIAPILTPFNNDLTLAADLYVAQAQRLLDQGIHYLAPFGTTGEALSMSVPERLAAVDALLKGGIPPAVLMPGAGLCNLADSVALCWHAQERECAGVMTLPPFFYKNASDDGLYEYFSRLIASLAAPGLRICLYHIPPLAGIGFSPGLAGRLATDFPDHVVAYKDSSGDFDNTQAVIAAAPGLAVFPGSETFLRRGIEHGAAGCISATCNVNARRIRAVYDLATGAEQGDLDRLDNNMLRFRAQVQRFPLVAALKAMLAEQENEPRWRNVRPPLQTLAMADVAALRAGLADARQKP